MKSGGFGGGNSTMKAGNNLRSSNNCNPESG